MLRLLVITQRDYRIDHANLFERLRPFFRRYGNVIIEESEELQVGFGLYPDTAPGEMNLTSAEISLLNVLEDHWEMSPSFYPHLPGYDYDHVIYLGINTEQAAVDLGNEYAGLPWTHINVRVPQARNPFVMNATTAADITNGWNTVRDAITVGAPYRSTGSLYDELTKSIYPEKKKEFPYDDTDV